jgi:hypothetical protein
MRHNIFPIFMVVIAVLAIAHVNVAAETADDNNSAVDRATGISPGMQREYSRDFLRPEFEHEKYQDRTERGYGEGTMRGYEGMDRAAPRANPGLERSWDGLESDRGRGGRY